MRSLESVNEALDTVLEGGDFRSRKAELFLRTEEPSEVLVNVESIIHLIEPCLPMLLPILLIPREPSWRRSGVRWRENHAMQFTASLLTGARRTGQQLHIVVTHLRFERGQPTSKYLRRYGLRPFE